MLNRIFDTTRLNPPDSALRVIRRSEVEAKQARAKFIEAEHLLLALSTDSDLVVVKVLHQAGLNHRGLAAALHNEHQRSLAFAGVERLDEKQPEAAELDGALPLGTSAKAAIKRAMIASRSDRPRRARITSTHLLVGILQAELGTVPRALAIAGVDRAALISRTRKSE